MPSRCMLPKLMTTEQAMSAAAAGTGDPGTEAAASTLPFWKDGMPDFAAIRSCPDIAAVVNQVLSQQQQRIAELVASGQADPGSMLRRVDEVELLQEQLHRLFAPVRHLHAVADNDRLRTACDICLPRISEHKTSLAHNKKLYQCYRSLAENDEFASLPDARRKVVQNSLRDFHLGGVDLPPRQRQRYREIEQKLTSLHIRFEQNITDSTDSFELHVSDEAKLDGLSPAVLELARANAKSKGVSGWVIGLQAPFYLDIIAHGNDRELRQKLYFAWNGRASKAPAPGSGPDNTGIMEEVVALSQEQARLLGFESYAHYALQTRMASNPEQVLSFLRDLASAAKPVAVAEIEELQQAAARYGLAKLEPWDLAWVAEKLRREKYDVSEEELRQFFPAEHVMRGLFTIASELFAIELRAGGDQVNVWNDTVDYCEVLDKDGKLLGGLYLDLYAREKKRGGAWMDDCRNRTETDFPLAFLNCNFTPPVSGGMALLNHDEVVTLFHEFGHTLHHLLTRVDRPPVAGINGVPWDAVEFPSQFLENWCWQKESLALISSHCETGEPIDDATVNKMLAARNFQAGRHLVRQIELALFDFRLYLECQEPSAADIQNILNEVRAEVAVFPIPEHNYFQNSFAHIFAGGYAAGYYSYLWAEVMAADAFTRFREEGVLNPGTGRDYREKILAHGGVYEPGELFASFRGRMPDPAALPASYGLVKS